MRITSKGQVTIPRPLREKYGLTPQTEVEFVDTGGGLALRKKAEDRREKIRAWMEMMAGTADAGLSTDEIMAMTRGED